MASQPDLDSEQHFQQPLPADGCRTPILGPLVVLRLSLLAPKAAITRVTGRFCGLDITSVMKWLPVAESNKQFQNMDEFLADFDETFRMFGFVFKHLKSSDISMTATIMDFINYTCNVEPGLTMSEVIIFVALWFICDENPHRILPCSDKGRPGRCRPGRKSKYKITEALIKLEQRKKAGADRDRTGGIWSQPVFWQLIWNELHRVQWTQTVAKSVSGQDGTRSGTEWVKRWLNQFGYSQQPASRSAMLSAGQVRNPEPRREFHNSQRCRDCRKLLHQLYADMSHCDSSVFCQKIGNENAKQTCGFDGQLDSVRTSRIIFDLHEHFDITEVECVRNGYETGSTSGV